VTGAVDPAEAAPRPVRAGWRPLVFAPIGDGQRRRRGSDGLRLAGAVVAVAVCVVIIRTSPYLDRTIAGALAPPPHGISWLVTVVYDAGSFGLTAVLVAVALAARRWAVARDIGVSAAGTVVASLVLIVVLGSDGGRAGGIPVAGFRLNFPVVQIAVFMAVATAALPYLARGIQRVILGFIVLVVLATVVSGHGLPVSVTGSLAIGWGATAVVHLVVGSPTGLPSGGDVALLLAELGIAARDVQPFDRQTWGVARYRAVGPGDDGTDGGSLVASVYGRDAADAQLMAKVGRYLFYRDSGPTLTFTRLQQVEREAYLTLRAARTGVSVPEVLEAGEAGPSRDALLVSRIPAGVRLIDADPDDVTDATVDDLFRQLLLLRAARLAHGAISGETVLVDPETGTASLTDFRNALSGAGADPLDRDLAGAVAAVALVVGPARAAGGAARSLDPDVLAGVLQHLRRAGLDPVLSRELRGAKGLLEDVRVRAAEAKAIEVPKLAEPRRVSWPTLIVVVGTLIGGWALIGTLIDVANSFDTIIGANWVWVVIAFVLAQVCVVADAVEDLGSVSGPLPFGRVVALEMANDFGALAGGTPAVFATRVRFFQQQGYDSATALSSGAVVSAASWVVKGALFLLSIPLAWSALDFETEPGTAGHGRLVWLILAAVVVVGVVVGVVVAVPRLRRLAADKVRPTAGDLWRNIRTVAQVPRKLVQLFGGSVASQLLVALTLGASLRAFGDHLSLATLILVIALASMVGGISPVPGGMGVVEAGLILGLTAAGVHEADATAAVFIQRLFTSYLPPIWGWFVLVWMRRREYV